MVAALPVRGIGVRPQSLLRTWCLIRSNSAGGGASTERLVLERVVETGMVSSSTLTFKCVFCTLVSVTSLSFLVRLETFLPDLGIECGCAYRLDGVSGVRADVNSSDEAIDTAGDGDRPLVLLLFPFVDFAGASITTLTLTFRPVPFFLTSGVAFVLSRADDRRLSGDCGSSFSSSSSSTSEAEGKSKILS